MEERSEERKKKEGRAGGGNELNYLCCCYSNRSQLTQAVFRKEEDTEQASNGRTEKQEKEERFSRGEWQDQEWKWICRSVNEVELMAKKRTKAKTHKKAKQTKQEPERVGLISRHLGIRFPRWLSGKESTCQCSKHRRPGFYSWVETIPWRRNWQTSSSSPAFLPEKSQGQDRGTWQATVHGVAKSWMWLSV